MSAKSEADMALADKIDLARTLVRYKARRRAAHELNEAEEAITKRHNAEIANGGFTQIDLDSISVGSLTKELPSGDNSGKDSDSAAVDGDGSADSGKDS